MKHQNNIAQVAALQPDYLGFIFYEKSPRCFDGSFPELPKSIKKVGVFVGASLDFILDKIKKYELDVIQLHGQETPEFCRKLQRHYEKYQFERSRELSDEVTSSDKKDCHGFQRKSRNDKKLEIIKVFSIKAPFNFDVLKDFETVCDYYLFDTKGPLPGGNGYTFDWDVLKNYPSTKPYFLSGGIGQNEINKLKEFKKSDASKYCFAIDVNSKFETEPGIKKVKDLEEFKYEIINH